MINAKKREGKEIEKGNPEENGLMKRKENNPKKIKKKETKQRKRIGEKERGKGNRKRGRKIHEQKEKD